MTSTIKLGLKPSPTARGKAGGSLAAEAIAEYLAVNEWQIAGIKAAIDDLDRGERFEHEAVRKWVESWGSENEREPPGGS